MGPYNPSSPSPSPSRFNLQPKDPQAHILNCVGGDCTHAKLDKTGAEGNWVVIWPNQFFLWEASKGGGGGEHLISVGRTQEEVDEEDEDDQSLAPDKGRRAGSSSGKHPSEPLGCACARSARRRRLGFALRPPG